MSFKKFDPARNLPRRKIMLTLDITYQPDHRPPKGALDTWTIFGAKIPDADPMTKKTQTPEWAGLMKRVRDQKDRAAFAELFTHFAPRIKGFLINSGADAGMAEECAQDVMTTLWRKADQFDPTRASVATWVFTIARNRRIDMLRKERRPEPEDLTWGPEPEPEQADVVAIQQETALLKQALETLPEAQRDLIQKAYFGDLSQSEIAKITGLPLGTIKSRLRLALERLRHAMK